MPTCSRSCHAVAAALATVLLGACSAPPVQSLDGRAYPGEDLQAAVLDVQVFQEPRSIRFTNTTARPLGPGWVWLNGWFSAPLERVAIGGSVEIPLRDFRDEFGQRPRAGGFWAARDAVDIVLAQVERANDATGAPELVGLIVVGGASDR
jgi:hypothetical protein